MNFSVLASFTSINLPELYLPVQLTALLDLAGLSADVVVYSLSRILTSTSWRDALIDLSNHSAAWHRQTFSKLYNSSALCMSFQLQRPKLKPGSSIKFTSETPSLRYFLSLRLGRCLSSGSSMRSASHVCAFSYPDVNRSQEIEKLCPLPSTRFLSPIDFAPFSSKCFGGAICSSFCTLTYFSNAVGSA